MNRGNEPAFPIGALGYPGAGDGLTIREWFTGMALQGLLACNSGHPINHRTENALRAVDYADSLLAALAETPAAAPVQAQVESSNTLDVKLMNALQEIVDDWDSAPLRVKDRVDKADAWESEARGFAGIARAALKEAEATS